VSRPNEETFMNRRALLTSAAFAAAFAAFFSEPASSKTATPGNAEKKHADETKKVGSLSLAASRVAVETAPTQW
jgi:putative membrane protein